MTTPGKHILKRSLPVLVASIVTAATCHAVTIPTYTKVTIASDPGGEPLEKAMVDINGDGLKDLVVGMGNAYGPGGVYWWQCPAAGPNSGAWTKHTIVSSGNCYEHSQFFDLDGDGHLDLICSYNSNVVWFKHPGGDGTGTWTGPNQIAAGIGHEVRLMDMDQDGKMDVVTSRTRNINFQNSATSWTTVSWGGTASGSALDGIALLDIGTGKGSINIVGATTTGLYWFRNPKEVGGNPRTDAWAAFKIGDHDTGGPCLATMDVNGDGIMDLVQCPNEAAQGTAGLVWWQAPADRTQPWTKHTIDTNWQAVHWIEPADMNNDGHPDFVISEQEQAHDPSGGPYNYNNDKVGVFYDDGTGNLTYGSVETTGGQNVVVGDVEGDGDLDFFLANHGVFGAPHPVELFLNNMTGTRIYQAEDLIVTDKSTDTHRVLYDGRFIEGQGTQLDASAVGDYVTYKVKGVAAGNYDFRVGVKKFNNKGTWQNSIAAFGSTSFTNHGSPVDEYSSSENYTEVDLGALTIGTTGDKSFKFTVTGKNASSSGYTIAFDYIKLIPQ